MIFNSIVPLPIYTPTFYNVSSGIVFMAFIKILAQGYKLKNYRESEVASGVLLAIILLYMGLRPISYWFGDMGTYNKEFLNYAKGGIIEVKKDIIWRLFMKFSSSIMSAKSFFFLCAFLYIVPLYVACKKWFGANAYLPFLMFIVSFSFWAYGVNGIRNGIATSLFVFALTRNSKFIKYTIFYLAFSIHASVMIPIAAYTLTVFYKNPKYYLLGWLVAIPLSLAMGGFWGKLFTSLGFGGDRITYLTETTHADAFSSTGFRWDFVLYSASAVFAGYYFILKKKFEDKVYHQLFNIYVTTNAFWILVIRASFSNRFAYLSWFLMAAVIFYPFFKEKLVANQSKVLAIVVFVYSFFSYYMNT